MLFMTFFSANQVIHTWFEHFKQVINGKVDMKLSN